MNQVVEDLFNRYDAGKLTRRQTIQGLTVLVGEASVPQAGPPAVAQANSLNHISLAVADVAGHKRFTKSCLAWRSSAASKTVPT